MTSSSSTIKKVNNVNSSAEVKELLDNTLQEIFNEQFHYKQLYINQDIKLFMGVIMVTIAGASFYLDKKFKFQETLSYQTVLVIAYSILSIIYWWFTKYIDQNKVYVAHANKKPQDKIEVQTTLSNYSPEYKLNVSLNNQIIKGEIKINEVFTEDGILQVDLFIQKLQNIVNKKKL
ncbi:signal peptidase complex subunit SPC2 SCDLUD_004314 [Saccharomycodes ludwigii]|uniref:signal peptidase complex subunit SPC2 n=1 Tax=Saccharomycodes ludwigii TaxID=36035 RepID=UPI001E8B7B4C|nr:hypothetical protein SCDLUD_004314 [Saccharomycodes ludwigii]KAH3899997.1 hypothetical protein SCDLUD_004314 [Saccharomycodes ludwigii]